MVKDGKNLKTLNDEDGVMHETNPWGQPGHGSPVPAIGSSALTSPPTAGRTVTLRLRYKTDASSTGAGWWVDELSLDGRSLNRFENAEPPGDLSWLDQFQTGLEGGSVD